MIVSTKGRYALRVMVHFAQRGDDGYIPLKEILLAAGFKEYNPGDDVELDLNDLKKDTIINIFKRS